MAESTNRLVQAEIAAEQRHVDRVYARLDALAAKARDLAREGHGRTATIAELGGVREEHSTGLFERDVLVHHAVRRVAALDAQHEGLVFGRLDRHGNETHYIGRMGVRDEEHEPLVLDWRAPAASVFYQATAVEPHGVIRRRVLRCRGERVIGIEDDLLDPQAAPADLVVIGDGALMAALTSARGDTMRDIVATIQREQDDIIRAPVRGSTLITGGPGTGKTVVALHRAAYLLYADRRRLENGGVLIVGPSAVFMEYIERVLPSLGETSATLRSVGRLVDGVTAERHDPPDCAAVKGSLRMRRILAQAVRDAVPGAPEELDLFVAGRRLRIDAAELARIRSAALRRNVRRNRARAEAVGGLVTALWEQLDATTQDEVDFEDVDAEVREQPRFTTFVDEWWPVLSAAQVLGWLADPTRLARYSGQILRAGEAELLAASWKDQDGWAVEDVPLLDELIAHLGTPPPEQQAPEESAVPDLDDVEELTPLGDGHEAAPEDDPEFEPYDRYAHVLVDEAQDLSPMQWRMLARRGRHASWTIVGDPAQSSLPDPEAASRAMSDALGSRTRRTYQLSTNYRNSAEIFEFAAAVVQRELPELDLPRAVRRTGHAPRHQRVAPADRLASVGTAVEETLAEVDGTVCVIVPEARHDEIGGWLDELAQSADTERVRVATAVGAKGLEYDGVVLVEPGEIVEESPAGVRTLYVALTRATQRLVTVATTTFG